MHEQCRVEPQKYARKEKSAERPTFVISGVPSVTRSLDEGSALQPEWNFLRPRS
jgi:hypothetical protein